VADVEGVKEPVGDTERLQREICGLRAELAALRARASEESGELTFRAIADSIDQMIWSTRPDGHHDYFNRRWYEYTGVPEGSTDGEEWNGMFHPDDREHAWAVWRRCLETGEPYHIEYRLRHRSGAWRWVLGRAQPVRSEDGAILRWYGTCTDIHDRRAAEDRLRASEARLTRALEAGQIGDYEWDLTTGRINWSDNLTAIVGLPADLDVDGSRVFELIHPEDRPGVEAAVASAIEGGDTFEMSYRVQGADGVVRRIASRGKVERDADGKAVRLVGVNYDVTHLYRTEAALKESEARLRALTDNLPMAMVYQVVTSRDMSERRYVYVSANCERLLGVDAAEAVADPSLFNELILPEEAETVLAAERAAADAMATLDIEMHFRRRDGTIMLARVISHPRVGEDGGLIWDGLLIDVTERRAAEAAARRTAALLSAIGDAAVDMIFAKDRDCRLIYANAMTAQTIGLPADRLIGLDNAGISRNPEEARALDENDRRIMESGRTEVVEEVYTSPDGTTRFWRSAKAPIRDSKGEVIGLAGVAADITDRKAAEDQLRETGARLEILNRVAVAAAGELDVDRLVQLVVDAGVELTGADFGAFFYNRVNEAGESYMLYALSGVDRSAFAAFPMPRATAVFHPTFVGEGVVRSDDIRKDPRYGKSAPHHGMPEGHLPVTSYLAVPVISRSGEVIGGLFFGHAEPGRFSERHEGLLTGIAAQSAVAIDNARLFEAAQRELGERRRAEEALRELNQSLEARVADAIAERERAEEALRQSQKMEAVGQLTGGIAHDFNNLLTVITGNVDAARRHLSESGEARVLRALGNAAVGAERAAVLTQRLLAFSRRQPLAPKPTDVNRLVTGMSDLLHRTLGETIEVETVLAAGLWRTEVDPHQLENAILNLAVNARDAMPDGGKLTIETANTHLDRSYVSANAEVAPGQYVAICVSDTGTGMDAQTVGRAFEPFFTTKEVGKGTGLGLSQVYGFVKQSGGHLKIYSEIGHGTTLRIYLPRLIGGAAEEEVRSERLIPEGSQDETILVCEDDDDVRAYTVEVLRELGYRVLEAHDGPSALRLLERQEGAVDLLFTDVVLPAGMTGALLAKAAREMRPDLKVLFTTGYARNAIVHHGRLDAGVELITKPFTYADLAARVRDMLDR
jgi:PAS domain S-box-containing protein